MAEYIPLNKLEIYQLSRQLSSIAWKIYLDLDWKMQKIMGDQFLEATDSVGANIAEGYARFHFLDKIKFYYIARASLSESSNHWFDLLNERKILGQEFSDFSNKANILGRKLNSFIDTTYKSKSD